MENSPLSHHKDAIATLLAATVIEGVPDLSARVRDPAPLTLDPVFKMARLQSLLHMLRNSVNALQKYLPRAMQSASGTESSLLPLQVRLRLLWVLVWLSILDSPRPSPGCQRKRKRGSDIASTPSSLSTILERALMFQGPS